MGDRQIIIDHNHPAYIRKRNMIGTARWNGAYYYSREITEFIIPNVKTDRNWITLNLKEEQIGCDHAIFFVHNHPNCPEWYEWLKKYDDLILVCCAEDDMEKVAHLGTPIFLPLSVDVEYVKQFRCEKTRQIAYAGRRQKREDAPKNIDYISGLPRTRFLKQLAKYEKVYAVDRAEIEAKILGCEILRYSYKSVAPAEIIDSREAAVMLQKALEEINE